MFVLVLAVYMWSMPRTVVLEDDGEFILSSWFNGISHPPGYPLFTLLGHFATLIPVGSPAFRVHLLSAVLGALSCACLYRIACRLLPGKIYAYTAGLGLGYAVTFWSQAIIAEVYTLNVLLFLLIFLLALITGGESSKKISPRLFCLMALLYGMGLSNHWPLLVLSTPSLLVLLWPVRSNLIRCLPLCLVFLLLGLSPYLWMVIRSQMNPEISFYGPLTSWHDFWFFVSRKGYADVDVDPGAGWWDKWHYCYYFLKQTTFQFGPVGTVFVWLGFLAQWRLWSARLCLALLLAYLGNTLLLILLLSFNYELWHQAIFRVYPLIGYAAAALWLSAGVFILIKIFQQHVIPDTSSIIPAGFCTLVVATGLAVNAPLNYRAKDTWGEDYARMVLKMMQPGAALFVTEDPNVNTIGYVSRILNVRPDVTLYHSKGYVFSNRLYRPFKTNPQSVRKSIEDFIAGSGRPIYFDDMLWSMRGTRDYGIFSQIMRRADADMVVYELSPVFTAYIAHILYKPVPVNLWENMHRRSLLEQACRIATSIVLLSDLPDEQRELVSRWSDPVCDNFMGKLLVAEMLSQSGSPDWTRISKLVMEAEKLKDEAITKDQLTRLEKLEKKTIRFSNHHHSAG